LGSPGAVFGLFSVSFLVLLFDVRFCSIISSRSPPRSAKSWGEYPSTYLLVDGYLLPDGLTCDLPGPPGGRAGRGLGEVKVGSFEGIW
jgi:hypothetical protein